MKKPDWKSALYFVLTGLLLAAAAFFNKYPLTVAESGAWIASGFDLTAPEQHSLAYPLFMRAVHWQATMWTVVMAHGLLLNFLLLRLVTIVLPNLPTRLVHFPLVVFLVLLTPMSWAVGTLDPAIWLPMLLLAVFVLLKNEQAGWVDVVVSSLICAIGMGINLPFLACGLIGIVALTDYGALRALPMDRTRKMMLSGLLLAFGLGLALNIAGGTHRLAAPKLSDGFRQFRTIKAGVGYDLFWEDSAPYAALKDRLPNEINEFMNSRQNRAALRFGVVKWVNYGVLFLSILVLLAGLLGTDATLRSLSGYLLFTVIGSLFMTGWLLGPDHLRGSALVSLAPLGAGIVILARLEPRILQGLGNSTQS